MRATTSRRLTPPQASQGSSESRRTARFDLLTAPYAPKSLKQLDRIVTAGRGLAQSPMTAICALRPSIAPSAGGPRRKCAIEF
jgi:hypothetical protein